MLWALFLFLVFVGNVDADGTPIFIDELSDKDNKYCRTRVSCDRNPITKRCNVDADGGAKLNLCENQPGHPGILTSDNPVCQNSFAVNENIEAGCGSTLNIILLIFLEKML